MSDDSARPHEIRASHELTTARARELRETSIRLVARALELKAQSTALQEKLELMDDASSLLYAELRKHVEDYASTLRTLGETPERAIIEVKMIAVEAGREVEAQTPYRHIDHDGMRQDIVRWATQAYFAQ